MAVVDYIYSSDYNFYMYIPQQFWLKFQYWCKLFIVIHFPMYPECFVVVIVNFTFCAINDIYFTSLTIKGGANNIVNPLFRDGPPKKDGRTIFDHVMHIFKIVMLQISTEFK